MIINCLENLSSKLRTLLSLIIKLLSQDVNVNVNKLSDITNVPRSCELLPTDADAESWRGGVTVVTAEKARDRPQEWAEKAGDGRAGPSCRTCGRGLRQVLIVELSG